MSPMLTLMSISLLPGKLPAMSSLIKFARENITTFSRTWLCCILTTVMLWAYRQLQKITGRCVYFLMKHLQLGKKQARLYDFSFPENPRSNPNHGRAFLNCYPVGIGHAHREGVNSRVGKIEGL